MFVNKFLKSIKRYKVEAFKRELEETVDYALLKKEMESLIGSKVNKLVNAKNDVLSVGKALNQLISVVKRTSEDVVEVKINNKSKVVEEEIVIKTLDELNSLFISVYDKFTKEVVGVIVMEVVSEPVKVFELDNVKGEKTKYETYRVNIIYGTSKTHLQNELLFIGSSSYTEPMEYQDMVFGKTPESVYAYRKAFEALENAKVNTVKIPTGKEYNFVTEFVRSNRSLNKLLNKENNVDYYIKYDKDGIISFNLVNNGHVLKNIFL